MRRCNELRVLLRVFELVFSKCLVSEDTRVRVFDNPPRDVIKVIDWILVSHFRGVVGFLCPHTPNSLNPFLLGN